MKSLAEINWINLWFKEIYEINWRKLKEWDYYNGKLWNKDKNIKKEKENNGMNDMWW